MEHRVVGRLGWTGRTEWAVAGCSGHLVDRSAGRESVQISSGVR